MWSHVCSRHPRLIRWSSPCRSAGEPQRSLALRPALRPASQCSGPPSTRRPAGEPTQPASHPAGQPPSQAAKHASQQGRQRRASHHEREDSEQHRAIGSDLRYFALDSLLKQNLRRFPTYNPDQCCQCIVFPYLAPWTSPCPQWHCAALPLLCSSHVRLSV